MKISARIATTASSEESTPNIAAFYGLAGFVVSRRRCDRVGRTRSDVDRLLRADLVARQLARRLVAPLLVIAAHLVVVLVGHALLEAFDAFRDVSHHGREAVPAEQEQQDDREDQDMPNAKTAHGGTPLSGLSSPHPLRFPVEAGTRTHRAGRVIPRP